MGWDVIPWYTLTDDFDADFGVDQWHGTNAFIREGDRIFRTYFVHDRGDEHMGSTWSYLDITALGRQEEWEDSPVGYPQTPPYQWWNYHDAQGNARIYGSALCPIDGARRWPWRGCGRPANRSPHRRRPDRPLPKAAQNGAVTSHVTP